VLPAQLRRRQTSLLFLDHPDNLRLGETAFSMSSAPSQVGQTLHHGEGTSGGQVNLGDWRSECRLSAFPTDGLRRRSRNCASAAKVRKVLHSCRSRRHSFCCCSMAGAAPCMTARNAAGCGRSPCLRLAR
jgi:hypothetical protein